jgi:hypothetical protein
VKIVKLHKVKIVRKAKNSPSDSQNCKRGKNSHGVKIWRSDSENCKEAKNSHKKRKRRPEPNIEKRNRKDVHIDQYGVDWQHEWSGGNRDGEKRGKRSEKGERIIRNMIRPKEGEVKGGDK